MELKGANIDLAEKDCVSVTARNGVFFSFVPQSEEERREWVMAIGSLMQVFQKHWKDHPIVPVFEELAARVTQLFSLSQSPNQIDLARRLSTSAMELMTAYMWNSSRRSERIVEKVTAYIQVIKALISNGCPEHITDSLGSAAKQVVALANRPFPSLTGTTASASDSSSQSPSSGTTEFKSISFGSQKLPLQQHKSPQNSPTTLPSTPASSTSATGSNPTQSTWVATSGSSKAHSQPSSSANTLNSTTSPVAGRRAHASDTVASSAVSSLNASSLSSSQSVHASLPPENLGSSGNNAQQNFAQTNSSQTGSPTTTRSLLHSTSGGNFEAASLRSSTLEASAAETQQEVVLRLVKDIRATFVRSVESFKSLNQRNFEATVAEAERSFDVLRVSFDELLKPLESPSVIARLRETPERYFISWRRAVEVVKQAFASQDRTQAMTLLREALPAVGDAMGQASHVLCGAVFEAAQQVFAEQELKGASSLFFDLDTSRVAQFLQQLSTDPLRQGSAHQSHGGFATASAGNPVPHFGSSPSGSPSSPRFFSALNLSNDPSIDEFIDLTRKALLSAQTMAKICRNSFFDAHSQDDHLKHLSILERLNGVVDKIIADVESNPDIIQLEPERSTYLEVIISIREFGHISTTIIETIAELDSNPRGSLSTISPQQAMKSLAMSRGSTQAISSKLNSIQMRFSTAAKQLMSELERLLDLVPGAAEIDESKLSKEQLRARRQSMAPVAASTHFINHFMASGTEDSSSPRSWTANSTHSTNTHSDSVSPSSSSLSLDSPHYESAPSSVSPRSGLQSSPLSASSPTLPSYSSISNVSGSHSSGTHSLNANSQSSPTLLHNNHVGAENNHLSSSAAAIPAPHSTWSEKIRPRQSVASGDVPRLPTQYILGSMHKESGHGSSSSARDSPGRDSPKNHSAPSSAPSSSGADSMQWRKSVKSRDDPLSPRTMSVASQSSPRETDSSTLAGASSPTTTVSALSDSLSPRKTREGGSKRSGSTSSGKKKREGRKSSSSNNSGPITSKAVSVPAATASGGTAVKKNQKMQSLTVRGVTIKYPESINIWLEPEEGNIRYLSGTQLDSERTSGGSNATAGSNTSSGSSSGQNSSSSGSASSTAPLSPSTSRSAGGKTNSSRDFGRGASSSTSQRDLSNSSGSKSPPGPSSPRQQSPKGHIKSESDSITQASSSGSASRLNASQQSKLAHSSASVRGHGSGSSANLFSSTSGAGSSTSGSGVTSPVLSRGRLNSEPVLASATLNRLIVKLTSESAVDVAFMKSFLATYQSFTTPEELWGKLLERYFVPAKSDNPAFSELSDEAYKQQLTLPIHLRVANVVGMWLSSNYMDISADLMFHIDHFVEHTLPTGEAKGLQRKLKTAVEKAQADKRLQEIQANAKFGRSRAGGAERAKAFQQVMITARAARLDPFMFFNEEDIDPTMIAEQLTALDWSLFSKISNVELLNFHTSRGDRNLCPNLCGMIQRFNQVSSWVATNILWQGQMDSRVKVYTKVVQTAHALFKLNNFNATLAIISGLNTAAIHRLRFTFADLPKKEKGILALLMDKMSSKSSYKEYRETLKRVSPPKIPYMGVYLSDLTFIEDGNPNNIAHLINFHKRRLVYRVLQEIEQNQDTSYNIVQDPRLIFILSKLTFADDNELYNLSLLREPRGVDRADIR